MGYKLDIFDGAQFGIIKESSCTKRSEKFLANELDW